jgi:hypothetical protein
LLLLPGEKMIFSNTYQIFNPKELRLQTKFSLTGNGHPSQNTCVKRIDRITGKSQTAVYDTCLSNMYDIAVSDGGSL